MRKEQRSAGEAGGRSTRCRSTATPTRWSSLARKRDQPRAAARAGAAAVDDEVAGGDRVPDGDSQQVGAAFRRPDEPSTREALHRLADPSLAQPREAHDELLRRRVAGVVAPRAHQVHAGACGARRDARRRRTAPRGACPTRRRPPWRGRRRRAPARRGTPRAAACRRGACGGCGAPMCPSRMKSASAACSRCAVWRSASHFAR